MAIRRKIIAFRREAFAFAGVMARRAGAEFVGFPELSVNGYDFSLHLLWLRPDGPEVRRLAARAREQRVYLPIGIAEKRRAGSAGTPAF